MSNDVIDLVGVMLDKLANTAEGHKAVDDLGSLVGRLFRNLTEVQGLPADAAAKICSSLGTSKT